MTIQACKICCVVGARPNFMKIAPIMRALSSSRLLDGYLVHTGQHYDQAMKHSFFEQLGIPEPDEDLEVGSGTHAVQTAEIMKRFEPVLDRQRPDAVLVVGDVNSTIACGLVAVKKGIPLVHVESGLRSRDRSMPEEINRVLTDQISDVLFTTERGAEQNLLAEGIAAERIHFVGNVMIDTLLHNLRQAVAPETTLAEHELGPACLSEGYAILTLHRPANVDDAEVLRRLLQTVNAIAERLPVVFPVHPRTQKQIERFGLSGLLNPRRVLRLPPLAYLPLLGLMAKARLVLTDSGGIQEETTALGVPCLTLRENTERPITVTEGTNTVVGTRPEAILAAFERVMDEGGKAGRVPEYWDGKAAERIVAHLETWLQARHD